MNVYEARENEKVRDDVPLKSIKPGEVVVFAHVDFEVAIKEELFYMVTTAFAKHEGRVDLVNVANGECIRRDDTHRVVKFPTKLQIYRG